MDLRNHPEFWNWRRDGLSIALALAWVGLGYLIFWQIAS